MSVRTMARVWEFSKNKGNDLLMLLAIADFADDDGRAYPSVSTLAEKCRMKPRNASAILSALRASGELDVRMNEGPRGANMYRIVLSAQPMQIHAGVQKRAGVHESAPPPAETCVKPLQDSADEPSVNHQEPSVDAKALSSGVRKSKKGEITLAQFLENCKASGEQSIPESDPVWEYARKTGITDEMISVAWVEFKAAYLTASKRYADWRQAFRNAVRRNWYKLWSIRDGDQAKWTSDGEQARRAAA
jgi:hypothetical protein